MPALPLEDQLGERLKARRETLAVAESCSGGLISHRVTNVAGSSEYFLGSVVTYSNKAKEAMLGVSRSDLEMHGAVSESTARQMAEGVRRCFGSDWAVAVTGIAGPSGGTAEKPVGLVYVAVAWLNGAVVERNQFDGDRFTIKSKTADRALSMVLERLG
jgi:PncC family amidohydrolase